MSISIAFPPVSGWALSDPAKLLLAGNSSRMQLALLDDFANGSMGGQWSVATSGYWGLSTTGSITEAGGVLGISHPGSGSQQTRAWVTPNILSGDFDIQIDVASFTGGGGDAGMKFGFYIDAGNYFYLNAYGPNSASIAYFSTIRHGGANTTASSAFAGAASGRLRIVRAGTAVTVYYYSGGWVQQNSYAGCSTSSGAVTLNGWWTSGASWNAALDNFTINSGAYGGVMFCPSDSPTAESPWIALPCKTLDASAAVAAFENTQGGSGNIKYQYALNNGSYNGSWLTKSGLNGSLASASITDPANSIRLKAQLNSDGTQMADFAPGCITAGDLDYPASGDVKNGVAYALGQYTGTYSGGGSCDYPAVEDVREGVSYNGGLSTGTLDLPSISDVRHATAFDHNTKTGTAYIPAAADVRSGTNVDATAGTLNLPAVADVRAATAFDGGTKTGLLDLPSISDVRHATAFDHNTKTGTAYIPAAGDTRFGVAVDSGSGSCRVPSKADVRAGVAVDVSDTGQIDLPAASDVRSGVAYDHNAQTGTYEAPACDYPQAADVRDGVSYDFGALTGTLAAETCDYPQAADVRDGVSYDHGGLVGTLAAGTCDYPQAADVRDGVSYDHGGLVGTLAAGACDYPQAADVRDGVSYDFGALTGTLAAGTCDYPQAADVRDGVSYDFGALTGTAALRGSAPAQLQSFRDIEAAIISKLKSDVPALRTVESWAGQIADRIDSLTVPLPAAFVSYGGSGFSPIDGPSHREQPAFTVLVAARSMRGDGSERTSANGAYGLVQSVLSALANEDFGYSGLERLAPSRVALIASEGGAAVYGVTFQTAFDTQYNW